MYFYLPNESTHLNRRLSIIKVVKVIGSHSPFEAGYILEEVLAFADRLVRAKNEAFHSIIVKYGPPRTVDLTICICLLGLPSPRTAEALPQDG